MPKHINAVFINGLMQQYNENFQVKLQVKLQNIRNAECIQIFDLIHVSVLSIHALLVVFTDCEQICSHEKFRLT